MDINALLSPYARSDGGATVDAPLEAAVGSYLDAIEETEHVAPADVMEPTTEVEEVLAAAPVTEPVLEIPSTIEEIAGFDPIDPVVSDDSLELAAIDEPVRGYSGKHRAEIPADSVSPLVPVAATHRLSA